MPDFSKFISFDEKLDILIDKEGRWFHNGEKVTHPGVYRYLNSILDIDKDGYFLKQGERKFYIKVEDAPFVVKSLLEKNKKIFLLLNDDSKEELEPEKIEFKDDIDVYVYVKNGKFTAKFLRKALTQLYNYVVEKDDGYYLLIDGKEIKLSS